MDAICTSVIQYDLSGDNILTLCRNRVKLHLYHDLLKFNNIIDAIGKWKRMILLFPTKLDNNVSGHWIAVLLTGRVITHFDSYAFSWELLLFKKWLIISTLVVGGVLCVSVFNI